MNYLYGFMKKNKFFLIVILFLLFKILFFTFSEIKDTVYANNRLTENSNTKDEKPVSTDNYIYVDMKGAVVNPGLYKVEKDLRLGEVVKKAGGFSHANTQCVNLSKKVSDEEVIFIPDKSQKCETTKSLSQSSDLININVASEEQLESLTGIGEKRAQDIIKYREDNGDFVKKEDIKNVSGIGDSIYNNIKDSITV